MKNKTLVKTLFLIIILTKVTIIDQQPINAQPDTHIMVPIETITKGNQIWLKGDVLVGGAFLYNAEVEITLQDPNGIISDTFTTKTLSDDDDWSVHGFETSILDLDSNPNEGVWNVTVYTEGYASYKPNFNHTTFVVGGEQSTPTSPSPGKKDCYFKYCSGKGSEGGEAIWITAQLLETLTEIPIPNVSVEIQLNKPGGGINIENIITDSEGKLYFEYGSKLKGSWEVVCLFYGNDEFNPTRCSSTFKLEKEGCIIATAAFGSEMHPDVKQMRSLRDKKVRSSFTGDNFVKLFLGWYYSWSPPVAGVISESDFLRGFFRVLLTPLVITMRWSETVYDIFSFIPEVASSLSILTSAGLCGVFYIAPLMVFLNLIKLNLPFRRIHVLRIGLVSLLFTMVGFLFKSTLLNSFGFGVLAVLITLSIGLIISNLTQTFIQINR